MIIEQVRAFWLTVPVNDADRMISDYGAALTSSTVIVRVATRCGRVGHGETRASGGAISLNHALVTLIESELGPRLIGEEAGDISRLWETLYNGARADRALACGRTMPILARRGLTLCGISAIDMALWDLLGQALDRPVWSLLGGRTKPVLPIYASGGWGDRAHIGDELLGYLDGFGARAVKMRIGSKFGDVSASTARVELARRAIGDEIALMVDAHGTYSVPEAKRFVRQSEGLHLRWFEEPISPDNRRGLAEIRMQTSTAIASGENDITRFDFLDYAEGRLLDVFQPDLGVCGGITEALRIASLASAFQVEVAPHVWAGSILLAATAHFALACPQVAILEYPAAANPLIAATSAEPWPIRDGVLVIPDRPGLGVALNDEIFQRYATPH